MSAAAAPFALRFPLMRAAGAVAGEPRLEERWVDAAKRGDADAFAAIVGRYQAEIFRHCARMTRSEAEGEELAQETFVRAWQALPGFRGEASLKNWLYKIATNLCLNHLESWRTRKRGDAEMDGLAGAENPERSLTDARDAAWVREAVTRLPPRQRAVVLMKVFEEMKFREIAAAMGLSEGGVKAHFFVAVRNLRKFRERALGAARPAGGLS